MKKKGKKGQIWVETVIYTLIAFVMIGAVLAVAQPKIQELQDKALIDQSIGVMKDINTILTSLAQGGPGNKRLLELTIKKGSLTIDGQNDSIVFNMDSSYAYSEPGENVYIGDIIVHTRSSGDTYTVNLSQNYSSQYNFTYNGQDSVKIVSQSSTPYQLFISNNGKDISNKTLIDFQIS